RGVRAGGGRGVNDAQWITVQIAVLGQRRDRDRRVFRRRRAIINRHRRIVDWRHRDRHGGRGTGAVAVADGVRDGGRPIEIGGRAEEQIGAAHDDHRTVGARGAIDDQGITVQVAVVGQRRDGDGHVFRRGGAVINRHGRVVDRRGSYRHGGRGAAAVVGSAGVRDGRW